MGNYGFSDWFTDMQLLVPVGLWQLMTFFVFVLIVGAIISLFLCIVRSFVFDIAVKEDIVQDRVQCVNSWYYGEDYRTVEIPKEILRKHMIYANLSYHTFWNVVIMGRWRLCGKLSNRIYFNVNRFSDGVFSFRSFRLLNLFSLLFIWGYPIFLVITLLRMALKQESLC